jgi:hypothetical protein
MLVYQRVNPLVSGILAVTSPQLRVSARTVPPEDLTPTDLADLASAEVATNPAKVGDVWMDTPW